jgi:ABC-type multidrug transport system fused ATPase/permease subunit
VALVGPSGAGKTTVVNLLTRFWDYEAGSISINGKELKEHDADEVREAIGVISQQTYLFNATLRENLLVARPMATQAELDEAMRRAQLTQFVQSLPQGYETWVGEHGLRLSGGERQRVAIARALLRETPLLILDEPTANLDPATERDFLKVLQEVGRGRTVLLITHRLVGLEAMDDVWVMDGGRIVQRGRQEDLVWQEGTFQKLWGVQNRVMAT